MSEPVPIPNLEGRPCWILVDEEKDEWTRGVILCAWFEPSHTDNSVDDDPDSDWRQYPTVLVKDNADGGQWIMQMPDGGIAFRDKPSLDGTVVGEGV